MKLIRLLLIVAAVSQACAVHPHAAIRRSLAGKLTGCIREYPGNDIFRRQCIKDSVVWCRERGLEASCAYDELITNPPKDRL